MYASYIYIYASKSERDRENCPTPLKDGHWEHQGADNGEQRAHLLAEHIGVASQSTFKSNIPNIPYHIHIYIYVHLIIVGREKEIKKRKKNLTSSDDYLCIFYCTLRLSKLCIGNCAMYLIKILYNIKKTEVTEGIWDKYYIQKRKRWTGVEKLYIILYTYII